MTVRMTGFGYAAMLAGAMTLAACDKAAAPTAETTIANGNGSTLVRENPAPAEAPAAAPAPAATVLQSQPGPDGAQLDLIKVAVTGDILTVTLRCSSTERINTESFSIPGISVIDDATSQRISVLKDNSGQWLASNVTGDRIMAGCESKPGVIWAKFAAPSAGAKTVSINLPQVAPFDGVPVTR